MRKLAYSIHSFDVIEGRMVRIQNGFEELFDGLEQGKEPMPTREIVYDPHDRIPALNEKGKKLYYTDRREIVPEDELVYMTEESHELLSAMVMWEGGEEPKSRLEIALEVYYEELKGKLIEDVQEIVKQKFPSFSGKGIPY